MVNHRAWKASRTQYHVVTDSLFVVFESDQSGVSESVAEARNNAWWNWRDKVNGRMMWRIIPRILPIIY